MKSNKTELRFFTIMEYEKEQEYLRKKHCEGWKFTGVTLPGFYHFVKCEPEDVVYQLDYNQEGIAHKDEYVQMFGDCGWKYLTDFVGYSYFCKPASELKEDEGIFCDDSSRLDMMERVFKGRMVPLLVILACIIIPQLYIQFSLGGFYSPLFLVYACLLVIYISIFVQFGIQYWKYKKKLR